MALLKRNAAVVALICMMVANLVSAAGIDPPIPYDLPGIIQHVINFLFGLALLLCPIFVIWGGMEIAASGGAPQKIAEGKNRIIYSLVGLVIMALAGAFVKVIKNSIGVD